jgi:apolipoprotein N-acyltransferase
MFMKRAALNLALLAASTLMLSLAFAPVRLYFLAWVGLVPWIYVIRATGSHKGAFAWGFVGGWMFFLANMWWLWFVSAPGMFALTIYLAIFWGLLAVLVRPLLRRWAASPVLTVLMIAVAWTAFEWLRGNVSFLGKQGLPWLYLGVSQSPILMMCQIADITSVLGVSFWVVLVNVLVALVLMNSRDLRRMVPAIATVGAVVIAFGVYGAFRMAQRATSPGPTVLVVQANYPQSNTGEKGAPIEQIVDFHLTTTRRALQHALSQGQTIDLVVWSETMMPPINRSAREFARGTEAGEIWQLAYEAIRDLASEFRTPMLVGGVFEDDWSIRDDHLVAADRRNSAFFFDSSGNLVEQRYDKIHLVPFGEYIPFKHSIPPLYRLFIKLGPNYYEEYALTAGSEAAVFSLNSAHSGTNSAPVRFIVPICFEDIVPDRVASMLDGGAAKKADFLVNITNDGWFRANQMPQHLQAALFRSIENRVPTARSVNTGISGFIDSVGRVGHTIPAGTEGAASAQLALDRRVAPYTRIGDAFPIACVAITAIAVLVLVVQTRRDKT